MIGQGQDQDYDSLQVTHNAFPVTPINYWQNCTEGFWWPCCIGSAWLQNIAPLRVPLERSCWPYIWWYGTGGFQEQDKCFFNHLRGSIPTRVFHYFPPLRSVYRLVLWGCGLQSDTVNITISEVHCRPLSLPCPLLSILVLCFLPSSSFFVLFHSRCSQVWVFWKTLQQEFLISYSHTEWYFPFSFFVKVKINMPNGRIKGYVPEVDIKTLIKNSLPSKMAGKHQIEPRSGRVANFDLILGCALWKR